MIDVTERALDELATIREANSPQPGQGITLVVSEGGDLSLGLAWPQEQDQIFERDGEPVMIVPQVLSEPLDGVVLDYSDRPGEEGFTLQRPGGMSPDSASPTD